MIYRYTTIMQISTAPADLEAAGTHVAGWSESHWHQTLYSANDAIYRQMLLARARLLPGTGAIVGYRIAAYDLVASSLRPQGASTGKLRLPGSSSRVTDLPQVALEFGATSGIGNSTRFSARGIPDDQMTAGEYQPDTAFKAAVTNYCSRLADYGFGFVGRLLSAPQPKILSIVANVMTTTGAIDAVVGETIVTLIGVKDVNGKPISGNYRVTELVDTFKFRLEGLPAGTVVGASGYARKLVPAFIDYVGVTPARAVVRKVGRPFEQYRGRASKRRTAA